KIKGQIMPSPVSLRSNPSTSATTPSSTSSKPTPLGISSSKSTIQSADTKKVGFIKTITESLRIILKSIFEGIGKVFFCIFPFFKNIFVKKEEISPVEQKYYDYQRKLYRVDSLSPMLAKKEAEDLLPEFNAFEKLGKIKLEKEKNKSIFSRFIKREKPSVQEIVKIGKDVAKKDHLKLIAVLKEYYTDQIPKLEDQLKIEKESS
nr:hypothetical protein [Candidatus Anoxychlamydiales bacterium]